MKRLARKLINMTNHSVSMYEELTGEIVKFRKSRAILPVEPKKILNPDLRHTYYIYDIDKFIDVKLSGRKLDDIAVIAGASCGRNGRVISRLVWGEDMETPVRFQRDTTWNSK